MGAFFTNLHVRNATTSGVCAALPGVTDSRAYVSPASLGWVTVYLEATEDQDAGTLCDIASELSKTLRTDALAFMVHDSDILFYWLYRGGTLTDEFNSAPDYFGERVSDKTRARVRGNTDALLPLCLAGTTRDQLDAVLHPPDGHPHFAEEIVNALAGLLGIDETRATLGFKYFSEEGPDMLPDAAEFEPVGAEVERQEAHRPDNVTVVDFGGTKAPKYVSNVPTLDSYPIAINMLTQTWNPQYSMDNPQFVKTFGKNIGPMMKQMQDTFDKGVRDLLKKSTVPNLPTAEELAAARDRGAEALAALIAEKTPGQLTEIGVVAAMYGLVDFVAALLKRGLDPNAANAQGRTTLSAAEQNGTDSAVYQLVKATAERK